MDSAHRYKSKPLFSKTGFGSLGSASTGERAKEVAQTMDLTRNLELRAQRTGKGSRRNTDAGRDASDRLRAYHRRRAVSFFQQEYFRHIGRELAVARFSGPEPAENANSPR